MFDRENEIEIDKFKMFWKVDSIIFPTSYPAHNFDTGKASKIDLQKGIVHQIDGVAHQILQHGNFQLALSRWHCALSWFNILKNGLNFWIAHGKQET